MMLRVNNEAVWQILRWSTMVQYNPYLYEAQLEHEKFSHKWLIYT
jgi:hypothetical protein